MDTGLVQKDIQERFRCTAENRRIFCVGAAGNAGFRKRSGDAFCRLGRDDVIYCLNAIRQYSGERDGAVLGKDAGGRGIRGIYGAIGFSGGNQRIADAAAPGQWSCCRLPELYSLRWAALLFRRCLRMFPAVERGAVPGGDLPACCPAAAGQLFHSHWPAVGASGSDSAAVGEAGPGRAPGCRRNTPAVPAQGKAL